MPFSYLGTQGVVQRLALNRIFHALGASRQTGGVCAVSAVALLVEGHPIGVDPEETPEAKLVILWGQNVLSTCHHQWHFIEAARKRGAKIIAIDPCRTRTARQCDLHLAPRPGTDAMLAAAIGRHLLAQRQGRSRPRGAVGGRSRGLSRERRTLDLRAGGRGDGLPRRRSRPRG